MTAALTEKQAAKITRAMHRKEKLIQRHIRDMLVLANRLEAGCQHGKTQIKLVDYNDGISLIDRPIISMKICAHCNHVLEETLIPK